MTNKEAYNWFRIKFDSTDAGSDEFVAYYKATSALAFRIPKPPVESDKMLLCPTCHRILTRKNCVKNMYKFCPRCGMAIEWGN